MIAMALSCDPNLLIADEPTTALDVTTQAQILDLLRRLQEQRGMAIMLITHNLGVVAEMADERGGDVPGASGGGGPGGRHLPRTRASLHPGAAALHSKHQLHVADEAANHHGLHSRIPTTGPPGCPFHPRCPSYIRGTCEQREPGLVTVNSRQQVSCFLYEGA